MIKILYSGGVSACMELKNDAPYYAPEKYNIYLNGEKVREADSNVFSLFGLSPDTEYHVRVNGASFSEEISFRTKQESCALNIRDFGAAGDGVTDDTDIIQFAVTSLPPDGRIYFPPGRYLIRPVSLKSRITIELSEGAVLLGCPDREKYPVVPGIVSDMNGGPDVHFGGFEGEAKPMYQSLLNAQYAENISVVGLGIIDGNAENSDFWKNFDAFPAARPRILFFNRCENITIHGVRVRNSPSWHIHPYYTKQVGLYDLKISAPKNSPNTDAIDPESCDGVEMIGCRFTVGDDCIAIKSGKIALGSTLNRPADHYTIRNCLMEFGHGAVVLGSEIGAGVRNLSVSQCYFRGTDRGLRIKCRRGRGKNCVIDGVSFDNIKMENVLTPVAVNLWYNCCDPDRTSEYVWSREKLPVDDRTPRMGKFLFKNLDCTGAEVAACYIDGLPEAPIEEIALEHIRVRFSPDAKPGVPIMENFARKRCRLGLYLDNVRHIRVNDVILEGVDGEGLIANHCERLEKNGFYIKGF